MRAAIVGVGRMGRRHIQAARDAGLDVRGVFDVSPDALKLAGEEYQLADHMLFRDLDQLYSTVAPECVVIATTADGHCAMTGIAAARGVQCILVEKPMAVSLQECDQMIDICDRHGARLAVNHQMRFMEQYTEPKRLLAAPAFGGMTSMTVVAGNFGLAMNGTHYFEAFRFLADESPLEVCAWLSSAIVPNPRGIRFQDRAGSLRAVTASGKRLYMEIGDDQGHGVRAIYGARNGMITVDELSGELLAVEREERYRDLPTTRYGMPGVKTQRAISPAEVIDASAAVLRALLAGVNSVSAEDGRGAVEVLVATYQSSEQGGVPVRLGGELDRTRIFPWA